jgi:Tfp pilus assembly protein PilV
MITILLLSIILVAIAAVLLYQSKKTLDYQIEELDKKLMLQTSANKDLERAQLRYQQLNYKLNGELEFWKKRRTMLPKAPKNTRIKKIRGKKRNGRK